MSASKERSGCLPGFLQALLGSNRGEVVYLSDVVKKRRAENPEPDPEPPDSDTSEVELEYPYVLADSIVTRAELTFYRSLCEAVCGRAFIMSKVRLADIVKVTVWRSNWSYLNRVAMKHVDFLLCDCGSLKPLCAIELDDRSHQHRKERDAFVDRVFETIGLPLVRVPARKSYDVTELVVQLAPHLESALPAPVVTPKRHEKKSGASSAIPTCPRCGSEMVLRTATKGQYAGQRFFACTNFPQCRGIVNLESPMPVK